MSGVRYEGNGWAVETLYLDGVSQSQEAGNGPGGMLRRSVPCGDGWQVRATTKGRVLYARTPKELEVEGVPLEGMVPVRTWGPHHEPSLQEAA